MHLFGNSDRRIAYWLIIVAIMIYAMVAAVGKNDALTSPCRRPG